MDMDNDDQQIGRILSRREALAILGVTGTALALGPRSFGVLAQDAALPACVVKPEQTEGPYFVDTNLERSDIRSDPGTGMLSQGVPIELLFQVSRVGGGGCVPLSGALIDVWQCDALGVYSGVRDRAGRFDTSEQQFLRGHQTTDADGAARFLSIYPGWYPGRTVHIHFKIRHAAGATTHDFTSQLYFDDAMSDAVFREPPYAQAGERRTRNAQDGIYGRGGQQLTLAPVAAETGGGMGYRAVFEIGLQLG